MICYQCLSTISLLHLNQISRKELSVTMFECLNEDWFQINGRIYDLLDILQLTGCLPEPASLFSSSPSSFQRYVIEKEIELAEGERERHKKRTVKSEELTCDMNSNGADVFLSVKVHLRVCRRPSICLHPGSVKCKASSEEEAIESGRGGWRNRRPRATEEDGEREGIRGELSRTTHRTMQIMLERWKSGEEKESVGAVKCGYFSLPRLENEKPFCYSVEFSSFKRYEDVAQLP
ncbi:hypothetical protein F2P81_005829 [Scophthalmus maximus]|uniref:Uncharacterized protein n=1 Tax=Scophthalmus maximus TaxID=52904 RepID=A0A6A4T7L8_SCOMX|nr:hypothetical protein F2P81_005829 [Scophthalmus maximus]